MIMPIVRITRFTAEPAKVDDLLKRRTQLIETVRGSYGGLTHTRLVRIDDETWLDAWTWDSLASAQAVMARAPEIPEVAAVFALVTSSSAENGELVDER